MELENKFTLHEKCFRFLNKICLSQNYLNKYVDEKIDKDDLKKYSCGHWGNAPAINLLYVHLIDLFKRHNLKANIIVGTGHSGSSVCANLWLSENWNKNNPQYDLTKKGLSKLINDFGESIRTEINPFYPTTLYDGGELGYSLAFAYGYSYCCDLDILPCIIGDGECETATLISSFQLNKLINNEKVLPIINLNGYKMTSQTFLFTLTDCELKKYFSTFGYEVIIVDCNHGDLSNALEYAFCNMHKHPLIIFRNKKGFTGLVNDKIKIEGEISSHKNPLSHISSDEEKISLLSEWMNKYNDQYFKDNEVIPEIKDFMHYAFYSNYKEKDLNLKYTIDRNKSLIQNFEQFLANQSTESISILSPDEIISNKFLKLYNKKNTIEILNESVLQGFAQGLAQANNNLFYISYEAFVPIFTSMISQYMKYVYQSKMANRQPRKSLNYFLTSTAFENTYSHQNPEFVASLLNKEYKNINIYYPVTNKQLRNNVISCFTSSDCINVITCSKRVSFENNFDFNPDYGILYEYDDPDIVLSATGDYNLKQMLSIREILLMYLPNLKIKIVYISNIKKLSVHSKDSWSSQKFDKLFNTSQPIIYSYMGYKSVIRNLLYERNRKFIIYGYEDGSCVSGCTENKFRHNKMGKLHVIKEVLTVLKDAKIITKTEYSNAYNKVYMLLGKYYNIS